MNDSPASAPARSTPVDAAARPPLEVRAEADPDAPPAGAGPNAALLPNELLQPGEVVILLLKPSPLYIVLWCLRFLAVTLLMTLALRFLAEGGWLRVSVNDVTLFGLGVAAVRLFWQFLEWLSRIYVLTDRRVIRVKGVLRVQVFEAPLKQLQHTECLFSLRERLFGLGTIALSTAGSDVPGAYWLMIAHPLTVHQTLVKAINRYR